MNGTINLPMAGPVQKKYVAYGLGVVVLIAAVEYYRKQKAASAAAATTTSAVQTDPATGLPIGSPEDAAALQAQEAQLVGNAGGGGGGTATNPTPVPGTGLTTNAQWSQQAIDYLSNTAGMDAATVSSALGLYLAGGQLSTAQVDVVHQAIAVEGPPPVAAPDGYPPNIRQSPITTPIGNTGGAGTTGPAPWSIVATPIGPTEIDLSWTSQGPQYTGYTIQYGSDGRLDYTYHTSGTTAKIGALHPNTLMAFRITANGPTNSAPSPVIALSTPV